MNIQDIVVFPLSGAIKISIKFLLKLFQLKSCICGRSNLIRQFTVCLQNVQLKVDLKRKMSLDNPIVYNRLVPLMNNKIIRILHAKMFAGSADCAVAQL